MLVYFGLHGLAIYYFLTAGDNPGFADAESEQSSEMLQIQRRERSEDSASTHSLPSDDEENIGYPMNRGGPELQKRSSGGGVLGNKKALKEEKYD